MDVIFLFLIQPSRYWYLGLLTLLSIQIPLDSSSPPISLLRSGAALWASCRSCPAPGLVGWLRGYPWH